MLYYNALVFNVCVELENVSNVHLREIGINNYWCIMSLVARHAIICNKFLNLFPQILCPK